MKCHELPKTSPSDVTRTARTNVTNVEARSDTKGVNVAARMDNAKPRCEVPNDSTPQGLRQR